MLRKTFSYAGLVAICLLLFSCDKNNNTVEQEETILTNKWIATNMRHWYYWYNEIPADAKLNYNSDPEDFYASLLSNKDGKNGYHYSSIEKKETATTRSGNAEISYGFEFQNWSYQNAAGGTSMAINILYVLPNSPAEKAGMKRGEWIYKINGVNVNMTNIYDLFSTKTITLSVASSFDSKSPVLRTMQLTPTLIEENPVFYTTVFQDASTLQKKIGYLVYNHFTAGLSDGDATYDNLLKTKFAEFKAQGVEEFVLDLRYNGGGLVTSAQLLAEMLAPASCVGKVFCETRYNKNVNRSYTYSFNASSANLDLPRLFVLTGNRTASASEAIINGLRPFYNVHLLGQQTEGKNVGSVTLADDKYDYEMHPIVCQIYNSNGFTDYANGFMPDWSYPDNPGLIEQATELGDKENEILLKNAIEWIVSGSKPQTRSILTPATQMIPGENSLTHRKSNRLIVPAL